MTEHIQQTLVGDLREGVLKILGDPSPPVRLSCQQFCTAKGVFPTKARAEAERPLVEVGVEKRLDRLDHRPLDSLVRGVGDFQRPRSAWRSAPRSGSVP
jgi:hypothetical protein